MSVEKFNPSISGQSVPYTMVCNKVIQNIDNMEAFTVWVYLLSLPKDWNIVKDHVRTHFNIGERKLKKIFAYLSSHNLIKTIQLRDENGRMGKSEIRVLNGTEFTKNPNKIKASTVGAENRPAVNRTCGKAGTTNKTINKEHKKQKENKREGESFKNFPSPSPAPIDSSFTPSERNLLLAAQLGIDAHKEADKFVDYYLARGLRMNDWHSFFNNWLRKAPEFDKKSTRKEHPVNAVMRELKEDLQKADFKNFLN